MKTITNMEELMLIQTELKAPKNRYNAFGKYNYRSCEDILEAVKPLLREFSCYLTLCDEVVLIGNRFYIKATATLTNSNNESVTTTGYAREEESKKGMDESQITGASSTYARKYALNGLFCIDDNKDSDDTNEQVDEYKAIPKETTTPNVQAQKPDDELSDAEKDILDTINRCNNIADLLVLWKKNEAVWAKDEKMRSMVTRRKNQLNNVI